LPDKVINFIDCFVDVVFPEAIYCSLFKFTVMPFSPSDSAFNLIVPGLPAVPRTITRQSPLNAARLWDANGIKLVGLPIRQVSTPYPTSPEVLKTKMARLPPSI